MVFQSFALFPWLTVLENVQIGLKALGLRDAEVRGRALAAIDLIGLDGFGRPIRVSFRGGMRQRVGLARALVDEPFSALDVELPQPRDRLAPTFRELVERIYVVLTARPVTAASAMRTEHFPGTGLGTILHPVSTNLLVGLWEAVGGPLYDGAADLPAIASALHMEVDDLFPVAETLQMLRFAEVEGGDIRLTEASKRFAAAPLDERKMLLQRHLLTYVTLAAHI